jgi:hypothetical protein
MSSEPTQGPPSRPSGPSAHHEALTLAAYHEALGEFSTCRQSHELLLEQLGDVDRQAMHPLADARLALAGRLIAAAQVAERVRLPEPQVHGIIRAWLSSREAERDDVAPTLAPRLPPEDERICGLTQRLTDSGSQGGFSRAAWGIAGMVLQQLIHPSIEISRALALRETLDPLVGAAVDLTDGSPLASAAADLPSYLLTSTVIQLRADGRIVVDRAADQRQRHDAWLRIAGDAARAHARWSNTPLMRSIGQALARATERLAASLIPDEPERFDHEAALEHAVQAAFDAAVTALGMTTQPADPIFVRGKPGVLETLMEASSSGLIGAWVVDRAAA